MGEFSRPTAVTSGPIAGRAVGRSRIFSTSEPSVPRSAEQKKRNAIKYSRRRALLQAEKSAAQLTAMAEKLLRELARAGAPAAKVAELKRNLNAVSDDTRRRAAVWAILDALEAVTSRS